MHAKSVVRGGLLSLLLVAACSGGGGPTGNGGTRTVATIVLTPIMVQLDALGATTRVEATALDAKGDPILGADLTWTTSSPGVARVDDTGLVTAVSNGMAMIQAASGSASASAEVVVEQVSTDVRITPTNPRVRGIGATVQLEAVAVDARGAEVPGTTFAFASADDEVAVVTQEGLVTSTGLGSVQLTAASGALSGATTLDVDPFTDFSFLSGTWTVTSRFTGAGGAVGLAAAGATVETTEAEVTFETVLDGGSIKELYEGTRGGLPVQVRSLRRFYAPENAWTVARVDERAATMTVYEGAFADGVATLTSDPLGGVIERIVYDRIGMNAFEWRAERSTDGGATWTTFWEQSFVRAAAAPGTVAGACTAAKHREFDFWNGEWDVFLPGGTQAGTNVIPLLGTSDCVLEENWTGSAGDRGTSFNMYDTRTDEWIQVWTDTGDLVLHLRGGLNGAGQMVLAGSRTRSDGVTVVDRVTWTPNMDGSVRQLWEFSTDGGTTFSPVFDGTYRPR